MFLHKTFIRRLVLCFQYNLISYKQEACKVYEANAIKRDLFDDDDDSKRVYTYNSLLDRKFLLDLVLISEI